MNVFKILNLKSPAFLFGILIFGAHLTGYGQSINLNELNGKELRNSSLPRNTYQPSGSKLPPESNSVNLLTVESPKPKPEAKPLLRRTVYRHFSEFGMSFPSAQDNDEQDLRKRAKSFGDFLYSEQMKSKCNFSSQTTICDKETKKCRFSVYSEHPCQIVSPTSFCRKSMKREPIPSEPQLILCRPHQEENTSNSSGTQSGERFSEGAQ